MILADKIIDLRKKSGMSQEELADALNVSRQAVSKWEGALSTPDLDKIIKMSDLFGVSTDYLLKDSQELPGSINMKDTQNKVISMEEANEFISIKKKTRVHMMIGVFLCVISPVLLIFLAGYSEEKNAISEDLAAGIGLISLLVLVTIAVSIFLYIGFKTKKYEYLDKEKFDIAYGVEGMVKKLNQEFELKYTIGNAIGVVLCIASVIPLLVSAFLENDFLCIISVCIILFLVGIATMIFIYVGTYKASLDKILQVGDYSKEKKNISPIESGVTTIFWLLATGIYLLWSFLSNDWGITWITWIIASFIYVILKVCFDMSKKHFEDK